MAREVDNPVERKAARLQPAAGRFAAHAKVDSNRIATTTIPMEGKRSRREPAEAAAR